VNRNEVIDLLTLIASYDRRTAGNADVAAWKLAVGDLDFADAQAAAVEHYRESADWITPAHVRKLVRAARNARQDRVIASPPPPDLTDDPAAYREALKANIQSVAEGFGMRKALAGTQAEPPEAWRRAREAVEPLRPDKRQDALRQASESREDRHDGLDKRYHAEGGDV
jgi:hypothetical protein